MARLLSLAGLAALATANPVMQALTDAVHHVSANHPSTAREVRRRSRAASNACRIELFSLPADLRPPPRAARGPRPQSLGRRDARGAGCRQTSRSRPRSADALPEPAPRPLLALGPRVPRLRAPRRDPADVLLPVLCQQHRGRRRRQGRQVVRGRAQVCCADVGVLPGHVLVRQGRAGGGGSAGALPECVQGVGGQTD